MHHLFRIGLLLSITASTFLPSYSQDAIKKYTLSNAVAIRSIDPGDSSYSDLEAIGEAIGNSRIVMLGEQDHGDAPSFLAKTRLIKYLHEKKQFDVLLFESDFYSLTSGFSAFTQNTYSISQLLYDNIFTIWTKCDACGDLFRYIKESQNTSTPIIPGGFDSQLHGAFRKKHYKNDLVAAIQEVAGEKAGYYLQQLVPLFIIAQDKYPLHPEVIPTDSLNSFGRTLDTLIREINSVADSSFSKQLILSLRSAVYQQIYMREKNNETMTVRDELMASNISWLVKYRFPGKKVLIWAANYHVAKNINEKYYPNYTGQFVTMGSFLDREFGDDLYILGFSSYKGKAGRVTASYRYKVGKPSKNSFEEWMYSMKKEYGFVDFKKFRTTNPGYKEYFEMKGKSHQPFRSEWTNIYDGIFYLRDMYPCERID